MNPKAGYSTPIIHAASIERSLAFYELLGFETVDTDGAAPLGWARMHCEGGAVMFLRADEDERPASPSVLLYLYTPDLAAFRDHLIAHDIEVPAISFPDYMPSGEICLSDPDGNSILVAHWSDEEHSEWLERIGRK